MATNMDDPSPQSRRRWEQGHQLIDINSDHKNGSFPRKHADIPENKLTLIALRLALLQKMSTGLATQGFIWATVVLLGGFVSQIDSIDFSFVTIIVLTESARIFSRSHELQWTLQSPWSVSDANAQKSKARGNTAESIKRIKGRKATPSNRSSNSISTTSSEEEEEEEISFADWVFLSRNFSYVFYFLQLLSALSCATLSVVRFVQLSHDSKYPDVRNLRPALYIFYGLALVEASLSLLEKAYMAWTIHIYGLLEKVNTHYDLGRRGMVAIKRFFDITYLHCLNGTIFDGLNQDLVSFATRLLTSDNSRKERLGALVLEKLLTNPDFSEDTVGKMGTSKSVIEILVYLLRSEVAVTKNSATKIVAKLAGKRHTSLLIAATPGSMEYISSLLDNKRSFDTEFDEIGQENCYSIYHQSGLQILEQLSRDYNNCTEMARTIGVVPNIVSSLAHEDPELRIKSARILSKLYTFLGKDCFVQLDGRVSTAAAMVLKAIMSEGNKEEQVLLELANQLFTSMTKEEANITLKRNGVDDQTKLAMKLLESLKFNPNPSATIPETNKLAIELAISMMNKDKAMARTFRNIGMEGELKKLEANTSEIERSLIKNALESLAEG